MKRLILAVFILFSSAALYSQAVHHSTVISIPAKDSSVVTLDCKNSTPVLFSTPDDSVSVKTEIDTTYKATLAVKYSDGTNAATTLLAAGVYELHDPAILRIRFINMNAAAILIEIKYRCGY